MIIRKIHLENFGLYAGRCEIDLAPRKTGGETRPIVLIGGKNGSGKTTFLEGVRLALYGRRALGTRVGQSEYDDYLRKRVHHSSPNQAASVGLEFAYAEAGVIHQYRVRRDWVIRGKSVVETLLLDKDDELVSTVPRDEWQQFLQELIPPGVSQLFFFDGEKIREIADAEDNNEQLAQAIRGLLGIDLIERARTDLGLYLAREAHGETVDLADQLEAVVRDIELNRQQVAELLVIVGGLDTQRESQARASEAVRQRFVAEGGDAAAQRSKLEYERDDVRRRLAACNGQLREMANGLLPFAFAPNLIARFQSSLTAADLRQNQSLNVESLLSGLDQWRKSGSPKRNADWDAKHWADLKRFVKHWTERSTAADGRSEPAPSNIDPTVALTKLKELEILVRPKALTLCGEIESLSIRLAELESALARADNAAAGLLLDELRRADQRVGATEATLEARRTELALAESQYKMLERERKRLLDDQARAATSSHKVELAGRVAQSLAVFERRLLERKLAQLRVEFVRHFNFIARKEDLIADVRIDADTFATTLMDKAGRIIQKSSLSAGEQQVYAIAMLWALAKTSGRPLPMIIDTPLARLDTEHRENLLERYFPQASHQVILLSTDTEITHSLLGHLGRSVSHSYRLDYEAEGNRTVVSPGYFSSENPARTKEGRRALQ